MTDYTMKIPEHLISAVKIGKAVVSNGVVRNLSGKILGHLEMVNNVPFDSLLNLANPFMPFLSTATSLAGIIQNEQIKKQNKVIIKGIDEIKVDLSEIKSNISDITNLVKNLEILSWLNIGLSAINIGVSVAGFAIVSSKLNTLNSKIDKITSLLIEIINHEKRTIIKDSKVYLDKSIIYMNKLDKNALNDINDNNISNLLIESCGFIEDLIYRYKNNYEISLPLDYILANYASHIYLLKIYISSVYKSGGDITEKSYFIKEAAKLKDELLSKEIKEHIYDMLILSKNKLFSQQEIKTIYSLHQLSCQDSFEYMNSSYNVLLETNQNKYLEWQEEVKETKEDFVLLTQD